ncbi:hypothetical protein, partial [Yoonia sp.]|uniref:hypothetical protein n=1 Tax=Yoonia sp. TaxID=2212373 RepID=UPI0035C7ADD0
MSYVGTLSDFTFYCALWFAKDPQKAAEKGRPLAGAAPVFVSGSVADFVHLWQVRDVHIPAHNA